CEHPQSLRGTEREPWATPGNDINEDLGFLPIVELVATHIAAAAADLPELNVVAADAEFAGRIAHRRRTVAAPAGLMEHQRPMLGPQVLNKGQSLRGCGYSRRGHFAFHRLNFGLYVSSPGQRANQPFRPIWGAGLYNDIERLRREGRHGQGYLRPRGDWAQLSKTGRHYIRIYARWRGMNQGTGKREEMTVSELARRYLEGPGLKLKPKTQADNSLYVRR